MQVVESSRELEREALGRRLEHAAQVLAGSAAFVRLRSRHPGEADAAALKALLEQESGGPVHVAPLDTFLRCREARGADPAALRRLQRALRAALMRARAYYAGDAVYLLGFSPVAGIAGLRVTGLDPEAATQRRRTTAAGARAGTRAAARAVAAAA
jgi:hypothetical protein